MKAAGIRKYGKPEVFNIEEFPEPTPRAHEVKIKVLFSSVNPVDWKVRYGELFFVTGFKFPKILGGDFSGIVTECGPEIKNIKPGDEVFGLSNAATKAGAYAEYLVCSETKLTLKPQNLSHQEAACIPLAASTAYLALHNLGNLMPRMNILIIGCTGGVGHYAVQIAKAANCHVTGVCNSKNRDIAKQVGCDEVVEYDKTDFTKQQTKYDIIFDAAFKYGYWKSSPSLTPMGTYITTIPTPLLMFRHVLSFVYPRKKGKFVSVVSKKEILEKLSSLCNEGKLKPFIENTFPLSKIAESHALSETEKVRGKISIQIQ